MARKTFFGKEKNPPVANKVYSRRRETMSQSDRKELRRTLGQFDVSSSPEVILKKIRRSVQFAESYQVDGIISLKSRTGYEGKMDVRSLHGLIQ